MQELNQQIRDKMRDRAVELLSSGVSSVVAWTRDEDLPAGSRPVVVQSTGAAQSICYDEHCGLNLSKFAKKQLGRTESRVAVFLKPCDTYSMNQLISESQADRNRIHVVAVGCPGMRGLEGKFLQKCLTCKGPEHKVYDELLGENISREELESAAEGRFGEVARLEAMSDEERYEFWRGHLSKCVRCNACRNICPACVCRSCVFDNPKSGISGKANPSDYEEKLYHIVRAFHVAGRCSDCGECSRACPNDVPLHLLNRKYIKNINELYGDFQAGESSETNISPLNSYSAGDIHPKDVGGSANV